MRFRSRFVTLAFLGLAFLGIGLGPAFAQTGLTWKHVAGTTIDEGLPGPASGPVTAVWYAAPRGSGALLAQTASGRVFETTDFARWKLNTIDATPTPGTQSRPPGIRPEVIGGIASIAVSPVNPLEVTIANRFGVWRSLDGGVSWRGINEDLPNFPVRKLIDRRTVVLAGGELVSVNAGEWKPVAGVDPEIALQARFGATAVAQSNSIIYAGTADGRLLVSRDNAASWSAAPAVAGAAGIARISVDGDRPDVALAAAGSRLLRTVNGGLFWDDVTGGLPEAHINGIAADRSAGVVYLATDRGVFSGNLSLNDAGPVNPDWKSISRDLPAAAAWDVRLNVDNTLTVALDGYGVYEEAAPHQTRRIRIVNGADMSDRAAAPGSLVSVLGADVQRVSGAGRLYPVVASSAQSSQLQVPFDTAAGTFELVFETASDRWTAPLIVKDAAPAIFVDSEGAPLILDAASGLVVDPKVAIHAGSTVQILATGLGKVTPDWPSGIPAPLDTPPAVAATVAAFLDGTPVTVTNATLAPGYVGYYLVSLQIPSIVNRGANDLRIVMNSEESNRVKLYLEPDLPKY